MQAYLRPEDDDLPMRRFGPWVAEKLDYLKRYIDIFGTSMHNKPWRGRHYIDLFAGCGKCYVAETGRVYLGSPLLALTTSHPFTEYFFVDSDGHSMAILRQRCSTSPLLDSVHFHVGDANVIVSDIVEQILALDRERMPGRWSSMNLAFLDPDGLELHWKTVATLAQLDRMDLIIHYPQGGLNRYMAKAFDTHGETSVDLFFGGTEWRRIYSEWKSGQKRFGLHRRLMDHYKERLQDLGYEEVFRDDELGDAPLIRNVRRRAPLYRLLFASKHPLGHEFWQKVIRHDIHGQARLL